MKKVWIAMISIMLALPMFGGVPSANAARLVAAIVTGNLPQYQQAQQALEQVIRNAGNDASQLKIFTQSPNADTMSLTNSIRRSIAAGAELLITYGAPATLIAAKEAKDIPVLFAEVYDPVELGVVQTLTSPGANRSGASCKLAPGPLLKALTKLVPQAKNIGILYTSGEAGSKQQLKDIAAVAKGLGLEVVARDVKNSKEINSALADLDGKINALFLTESIVISRQSQSIIDSANRQRLPVFSETPGQVEQGAVLTLSASPEEQGKLVAVHALQILAGQKAFLLPVREPKQAELAVNRKASIALGLKPPQELLDSAKKVLD